MAMPAGFTPDGVPIGFEILGPAWSDQRLVSLAYAYEQAAKPRRSPPTTPALANGAAPRPGAVTFGSVSPSLGNLSLSGEFDPVSGRLTMELPARVRAASIQRGDPGPDSPGPASRNRSRYVGAQGGDRASPVSAPDAAGRQAAAGDRDSGGPRDAAAHLRAAVGAADAGASVSAAAGHG